MHKQNQVCTIYRIMLDLPKDFKFYVYIYCLPSHSKPLYNFIRIPSQLYYFIAMLINLLKKLFYFQIMSNTINSTVTYYTDKG